MKAGIIGAGLQGRRRAEALKLSGDELVMVADAHLKSAQLLAVDADCRAVSSWEEVTAHDEIGAVIVCTPTNLHAAICLAALNAGKHVLCEKPLALNPSDGETIVRTAREKGLKLECGFNLRHHPGVVQVKRWLDSGEIGEAKSLRCRYGTGGRPGYEKEWRTDPEMSGGGQLMDQGMHALDLARHFLGEFSQAFGFLRTSYWDICVEDNAFCLLSTEDGRVADIHVSWTQWKNLFYMEILGEEGYVQVEGLGGSYGTEHAVLGRKDFHSPFSEQSIQYRGDDQSWLAEWTELMAAVREDREPLGSGQDGLEALRLAYAIYESADSGSVVKMDAGTRHHLQDPTTDGVSRRQPDESTGSVGTSESK